MASKLSKDDVSRLLTDPSPKTRAETVSKIAVQFDDRRLSESERNIAEDIFRAVLQDVEVHVRETLSAHLKSSPDLPRDIALSLAKDVESVALPVLKFSEVLTDEDLIEIVQGENSAKQIAIAQRKVVSSGVADALIDTGNETAVAKLVSNEGAELTERAIGRVMTNYKKSQSVADSLSRRPNLPPALSEQMVNALTQKLQSVLTAKHDLPPDQISNLLLQARERATVTLISAGSSDEELERLVEQMHINGRLTPSVVLRATAMGDLAFFEMSLARLARIPVQNARILIHDQGNLGFESLYSRTGLPERWFPAFRAGLDVISETDYDGGPYDRERFVSRMVERMLTLFEDPSDRMSEADIEYLMNKLTQLAA
ncbi:MAG: DUF2336 domain-containing protein [Kiloniellales bacterium]|nr:DUF2336 domain-containing protein [Kiloniellales bacterium]